jgi:hypothetical protein
VDQLPLRPRYARDLWKVTFHGALSRGIGHAGPFRAGNRRRLRLPEAFLLSAQAAILMGSA